MNTRTPTTTRQNRIKPNVSPEAFSCVQASTDAAAEATFREQVSALSNAQPGNRHTQTWKSAVALGELVGAGRLDRARVEGALFSASVEAGREDLKDAEEAIRNGVDHGIKFAVQATVRR
jgi:hypothetical protein